MVWNRGAAGRPFGRLAGRYVSLVVQSPGRVTHQTHRTVAAATSTCRAIFNRIAQLPLCPTRKLGESPTDRIHYVRVGGAELSGPEPAVQAVRQLIEKEEPRRGVLHLDAIEVEIGGEPTDPVHRAAPHLPRRAPERMRGDGKAALVVYRMDCGRGRHARLHSTFEKEPDDVSLAARHLFPDHHLKSPSLRRMFDGSQRSFNGVVICDRDHVQPSPACGMLYQLRRCRPAVAGCRMHVEVRPTPTNHGCASYPRRAYHRLFHS
jgi:hypothetical protein